MSETLVEVFADIVCPFTHVGLRRLVERRTELGRDDVRLVVRAWPLEVINGEPMEAEAVARKAAALQQQVAPELFGGFDPASFPSTSLPALALTNAGYRQGVETGEAVALRLRTLTFDEGVDVSQPDVLDRVATETGLTVTPDLEDDAAILTDLEEGRRRGVVGSPHFFTPSGGGLFCPSLEIAHRDGSYSVEFDYDNFAGLIDSCFR
jgi:predicted DsbA family dithiol-disulfide isomerase